MNAQPRRQQQTLTLGQSLKVEPETYGLVFVHIYVLDGTVVFEHSTDGISWLPAQTISVTTGLPVTGSALAGSFVHSPSNTFFRARVSAGTSAQLAVILRDQDDTAFVRASDTGAAATLASRSYTSQFDTRAALLAAPAGAVGPATHVRVTRYHADGPVANILYELVDVQPTVIRARDGVQIAEPGSVLVNVLDPTTGGARTKYLKIADRTVTPFHFGAYGDAAPMGVTLTDPTYVAKKALEHDDYAALQAHLDYLQDGDVWTTGGGEHHFATSATLKMCRHRSTVDAGTIVPFGAFSEWLVSIEQGVIGPDPTMINVSVTTTGKRLRVCGRWQSRGVRGSSVYMSSLNHVFGSHIYGTGLEATDCYEDTWVAPSFTLCKERPALDLSGATAWLPGTTYAIGAIVRPNYAAWSAATTYAQNALVLFNSGVYRSLASGNLNNTPTSTGPTWWVRDEIEYYQAVLPSTGADPWAVAPAGYDVNGNPNYPPEYTTAQTPPAGGQIDYRIWKQVYPSEPLISIVNKTVPTVTDHQYFYGMDIRDCSSKELIRIDQEASGRQIYNIEFIGAQIHGMTPGVPAASGGQLGASDAAASANGLHIRIGRANRVKLIGCNIRIGGVGTTAVRLGGQHPLKRIEELHIQNTDINGEQQFQIGIYVGVSIQDVKQNIGDVSMALTGADSLELVDPAQRLNNSGLIVPQRFPDGTPERPALAFRKDSALGLWRTGTPGTAGSLLNTRTAAATDSSTAIATTGHLRAASFTGPETGTTSLLKTATDFAFYIGLGTAYVPRPSGDMNADTPAIAAALAKNTRWTEFQGGTYLLNDQGILIPNMNQLLVGQGRGMTIIKQMAPPASGRSTYRAISKGKIGFEHLTFDANNMVPPAAIGVVATTFCTSHHMDHFEILRHTQYGIAINGAVDGVYIGDDFLITKDAPVPTANQAILISNSNHFITPATGPVQNVFIGAGRCINSPITVGGTNGRCLGTQVEGFAYGSGFYTANPTVTGLPCERWEFLYCKASEGLGIDVNDTPSEGIENWAAYTQIVGCQFWNLAGSGIYNGGPGSLIHGNIVWNTGRAVSAPYIAPGKTHLPGAPGITLNRSSAANNSDYTTVSGNRVFDDQATRTTGTSTAAFGRELGALYAWAGLVGVTITEDNDWGGMPITVKSEGVYMGPNPQLRPAEYYPFVEPGATSASPVSVVDTILFVPCEEIWENIAVDSLALQVTAAGAGSAFKVGVWASGPNGRPTGAPILVENVGTATTAIGQASAAVSGKLRRRGSYWYGVKFTGTLPSVVGFTQTTYGNSRRTGRTALGNTAIIALTLADAYANAMPTLTGAEALGTSAALGTPIIHFRKA